MSKQYVPAGTGMRILQDDEIDAVTGGVGGWARVNVSVFSLLIPPNPMNTVGATGHLATTPILS